MRTGRRFALALAALAPLSLAACGGGSGPTGYSNNNPPPTQPPPQGSTSSTITVENNRFDPAATTVNVGTTVTWTWDSCTDDPYGGSTCVEHTVTFDGGATSGPRSSGTWSRQFSTAGTFNYRCSLHAGMNGSVTVR
jgi:plastocyanin